MSLKKVGWNARKRISGRACSEQPFLKISEPYVSLLTVWFLSWHLAVSPSSPSLRPTSFVSPDDGRASDWTPLATAGRLLSSRSDDVTGRTRTRTWRGGTPADSSLSYLNEIWSCLLQVKYGQDTRHIIKVVQTGKS